MTGPLDEARVDLVLTHIVSRIERRLILRRTVFVPGQGQDLAVVEQLWISDSLPNVRTLIEVLDGLTSKGKQLLRAEPVPDLPGMREAITSAELAAVPVHGAAVEIAMIARGVVTDLLGDRILPELEISYSGGIAGCLARRAFGAVVATLPLTECDDTDTDDDTGDDLGGEGGQEPAGMSTADAARSVLDHDIQDALRRVRWRALRSAPLEPAEQPRPATAPAEPHWTRWERRFTDARASDGAPTSYVLVLIGVEGASVGSGNEQYNLFRCRVDPTVDLDGLLSSEPVHRALVAFAESGGDPAARKLAMAAIRNFRSGAVPIQGPGPAPEDPRSPAAPDGELTALGGTVLICDCRGIQVGHDMRQFNTFARVFTPTIAAELLLYEFPALVGAIVDLVGLGTGDRGTLQSQLYDAVLRVAETVLPRQPGEGRRSWGSIVENEQAIVVGDRARVVDTHRFTVHLSSEAVATVREARESVEQEAAEYDVAAEEFDGFEFDEFGGEPQLPDPNSWMTWDPSPEADLQQHEDRSGPSREEFDRGR